jgi:hypothetical protein
VACLTPLALLYMGFVAYPARATAPCLVSARVLVLELVQYNTVIVRWYDPGGSAKPGLVSNTVLSTVYSAYIYYTTNVPNPLSGSWSTKTASGQFFAQVSPGGEEAS